MERLSDHIEKQRLLLASAKDLERANNQKQSDMQAELKEKYSALIIAEDKNKKQAVEIVSLSEELAAVRR